jgi:hypothetical protein
MWGSWYGVLTAAIVGGIILLASMLTGWTPLFAFGIAALAIAGFAGYYAIKGGQEEVRGTDADPSPASPEDQPEHQPHPRRGSEVAGGVWGEKREA